MKGRAESIMHRFVGRRDGARVGEPAGVFGVRRRAPEEQDREVQGAIQSACERALQTR